MREIKNYDKLIEAKKWVLWKNEELRLVKKYQRY